MNLLGFARSHSIVTRRSVSLSCATTLHPFRFPNFNGTFFENWFVKILRVSEYSSIMLSLGFSIFIIPQNYSLKQSELKIT